MTTTAPAPALLVSKRVVSLDALRGITIAFMIMVNNNADSRAWPFMKHADWNGMTATDLVFPTFLFLAGASIAFALEARLAKGATQAQLAWQTVRRAAILFVFGLIVNGFPLFHLGTLRIYGVLQRIAVCYLIAALMYLADRKPWSKIAVLVVALAGYFVVMRWVPVPGLGMPGRDIPFLDKDANMVAWLDRHIFPGRLYEGVRDPEGLLSDLPALGTALLGLLTGMWLRSQRALQDKASGLAGGAAACLALGAAWAVWFPLNKKLWTSSYVLVAAGCSLTALALCYWVIEVKGWRGKWTEPLLAFGTNSIAAYMISELLGSALDLLPMTDNGVHTNPLRWVYMHWIAQIPDPGLASFVYSAFYMLICFVPVWVMYKKRIFLKV